MTHGGAAHGDAEAPVKGPWHRFMEMLRRARDYAGPERDRTLFILKGTAAATIAWAAADTVLQAQSPAFAPFAALVMVQISVRESLLRSLRFALAASIGVSLQGVLGFWLDPSVWTFAAVAFTALALGQWGRLGPQGDLVATSAFFAYSVFVMQGASGDRLALLAELVVLVVVGCAVGIAVNLLVFPPLRLYDARYGLASLASALRDLLSDLSSVLGEREPTSHETSDFWNRGRRVESLASQAQETIGNAEDSLYWNPRRLLLSSRPPMRVYGTLVTRMARVGRSLCSITDILRRLPGDDDQPDREFLHRFASILHEAQCAAALFADLVPSDMDEAERRIREHLEEARSYFEGPVPPSGAQGESAGLVYDGLLLEAERVISELEDACDDLRSS